MIAKLCACALAVTAATTVEGFLQSRASVPDSPAMNAAVLVPDALPGYRQENRWNHHVSSWGDTVEDGAQYSPVDAALAPVQLDFFRRSYTAHNGVSCYWSQGERLRSQRMMTVSARDGAPVTFNIGVFNDGRNLRLAASTQCYADRCTDEQLLTAVNRRSIKGALANLFSEQRAGIVPGSIMLLRPYESEADLEALTAQMLEQFKQIVPLIDFSAARRLAALQGQQFGHDHVAAN